jgi:hypothetical protein
MVSRSALADVTKTTTDGLEAAHSKQQQCKSKSKSKSFLRLLTLLEILVPVSVWGFDSHFLCSFARGPLHFIRLPWYPITAELCSGNGPLKLAMTSVLKEEQLVYR